MKIVSKLVACIIVLFFALGAKPGAHVDQRLIELGKQLYFDPILSKKGNQSCATCHNPSSGFVDDRDNGVEGAASLGDDGSSLGDRQAPSAAYASFAPRFHWDKHLKVYVGGQFWDGREDDLEGQAGGPPLNPIEMGMPSKAVLVKRLSKSSIYAKRFQDLFGEKVFLDVELAYSGMARSIAAFERTKVFAPFDSKYDRSLRGGYKLTDQEELGKALFFSNDNTNCSTCHMLKGEDRPQETFTNYQFHNIGVPINKKLRTKNGAVRNQRDLGLFANPKVNGKEHQGKFKTPTLRNVAVTGPYMHNGVFQDLRTVILFYDKFNNTSRGLNPETGKTWQRAEIEETINKKDLKAKKLTDKKVDALVAFLKTLTDKRYEHLLEMK